MIYWAILIMALVLAASVFAFLTAFSVAVGVAQVLSVSLVTLFLLGLATLSRRPLL